MWINASGGPWPYLCGRIGRLDPHAPPGKITFRQSIFERIIGAGDLAIESAGERGQETFTDVRRPAIVQQEIYRQVEATRAREAQRASGSHALSVPEQLDKLDELRQRGVISQAEFDAKKAKLLDQI